MDFQCMDTFEFPDAVGFHIIPKSVLASALLEVENCILVTIKTALQQIFKNRMSLHDFDLLLISFKEKSPTLKNYYSGKTNAIFEMMSEEDLLFLNQGLDTTTCMCEDFKKL